MRMILLAVILGVIIALPATAGNEGSPDRKSTAAVIGYLETRDHFIAIKAGATATYTVKTKAGKTLAKNVTLNQLQAKYPELHKVVEGALANHGRNSDARLTQDAASPASPSRW